MTYSTRNTGIDNSKNADNEIILGSELRESIIESGLLHSSELGKTQCVLTSSRMGASYEERVDEKALSEEISREDADISSQKTSSETPSSAFVEESVDANTPSDGNDLSDEDDSHAAVYMGDQLPESDMPKIRLGALKLVDRKLSRSTVFSSIRRLEFQDVRNGDAAMKDLHRSFLHIYDVMDNDLCMSLISPTCDAGSHNTTYPTQELCDLIGMTPVEYRLNVDAFGYRAITATALRALISSAATKSGNSVSSPNPVLIEELVNTLSQAGICGFPYLEVQSSEQEVFGNKSPHQRCVTLKPLEMKDYRGVYITFKSDNELSVYSHFYPVPWLAGYAATHFRYDVSVCPDSKQLHYKNFVVDVAFPGASKIFPEVELRHRMEGPSFPGNKMLFKSPPRKMPEGGFVIRWHIPNESFPIAKMFDAYPIMKPGYGRQIMSGISAFKKRVTFAPNISTVRILPPTVTEEDEAQSSWQKVWKTVKLALFALATAVKNAISRIADYLSRKLNTRAAFQDFCAADTREEQDYETNVDAASGGRSYDVDTELVEKSKEGAKNRHVPTDDIEVRMKTEVRVDVTKDDIVSSDHSCVSEKFPPDIQQRAHLKTATTLPRTFLLDSHVARKDQSLKGR